MRVAPIDPNILRLKKISRVPGMPGALPRARLTFKCALEVRFCDERKLSENSHLKAASFCPPTNYIEWYTLVTEVCAAQHELLSRLEAKVAPNLPSLGML